MPKKVLLLDPPGVSLQRASRGRKYRSTPSMALAYLAESLREAGVSHHIIDMAYETVSPAKAKWADIIGIPTFTHNFDLSKALCRNLRAGGFTGELLFGGPHANALPQRTMEECPEIDGIVVGEGEQTLVELATGGKLGEVHGTVGRIDGGIATAPPRLNVRRLDQIPWPRYQSFVLPAYQNLNLKNVYGVPGTIRQMLITTSRGCPGRCTYCNRFLGEDTLRFRSLDSMIEEIEYHRRVNHINYIAFADPTLISNKRRFHKIVEYLNRQDGLYWECMGRLNEINDEVLDALAESRCLHFGPGIESCDDHVLDAMNKAVTYEQMKHWVTLARDKGVPVSAQIILGHPGETRESVETTIKRVSSELHFRDVLGNIVVVYPGTSLWDMVERGDHGSSWAPGMKYNWSAYTRRSMMIDLPGIDEEFLLDAVKRLKNSVAADWGHVGLLKRAAWRVYSSSPFLKSLRVHLTNINATVTYWRHKRKRVALPDRRVRLKA